jgi:hypothetical protein
MASICTIGDLLLDVIVLPDRTLAPDSDTPATIRLAAGGQAANVAAWASALGASSRLICKRGTDASSEMAVVELQRYGVEIRGPVVAGRAGVVVSIREQPSGRTMASDRGVSSLLDASEIDPSWVASREVLHVSGYCLMAEPMAQAAIYAASHARRVSVDLASAHDIELLGAQTFTSRLEALRPDLAFATEAERAAVPGFDTSWVILSSFGHRGDRLHRRRRRVGCRLSRRRTGARDGGRDAERRARGRDATAIRAVMPCRSPTPQRTQTRSRSRCPGRAGSPYSPTQDVKPLRPSAQPGRPGESAVVIGCLGFASCDLGRVLLV